MFRSASLFIGTSFTLAVFTIFATSNVDSIVGIPHKIYSMQRISIQIKSRTLCYMCPSAPRVYSEPGGQKSVLSLSLDRIGCSVKSFCWYHQHLAHLNHRADSRFAPSQWETVLLRNDVSHWLGANLESALNHITIAQGYTITTPKSVAIDPNHLGPFCYLLLLKHVEMNLIQYF